MARAGNKCRNPDGGVSIMPWCFITAPDGSVVKEDCFRHCGRADERCLEVDGMHHYRGKRHQTLTGKECRYWDTITSADNVPIYTVFSNGIHETSVSDVRNYCRNPTDEYAVPWCYVTDDTDGSTIQEPCFKECEDGVCLLQASQDYSGKRNRSINRMQCLHWDSLSYPDHSEVTKDELLLYAENYCRDPNGHGVPWCFTSDTAEGKEDCFKRCEGMRVKCGHGTIIGGQKITVSEICGGNLSIIAFGLDNPLEVSFPLKIIASISDSEGTEVASAVGPEFLHEDLSNGYDITEYILSASMLVPAEACDNRGAIAIIVLVSMASSSPEILHTAKRRVRIMCDFSHVDILLEVVPATGSTVTADTLPAITINNQTTSLSAAVTYANGFDFKVRIRLASGTAVALPSLVPETIGYMVVAFIVATNDMIALTEAACTDETKSIPDIIFADKVVATPIVFRTMADIFNRDLITGIKTNTDTLKLCGNHYLVIFVDPMDTLWNEISRCNNFIVFTIVSPPCTTEPNAQCELIHNPWPSRGDVRFVYYGYKPSQHTSGSTTLSYKPNTTMYAYQGDSPGKAWRRSDMSWVERYEFGRIRLLNIYLDNLEDAETCELGDAVVESGLANVLTTLEDTDYVDVSSTTATVIDDMLVEYYYVMSQIDQLLRDTTTNRATVNSAVSTKLDKLVVSSTPSITDVVKHNISKSVLSEMIRLLDDIEAETDSMLNDSVPYCRVTQLFNKLRYNLPMYEVNQHDTKIPGELSHLLVALPRVLVHIRYRTPMFSCMENILKNAVQYIKDFADQLDTLAADPSATLDPLEAMWMLKTSQLDKPNALKGDIKHPKYCGNLNTCIQKFNTMCEAQHCTTWEPLSNSRALICKHNARTKYVREHYKALALKDIYDDLVKREHEGCDVDPLRPKNGPVTLWKSVDDAIAGSVMYMGTLRLDNTQICWQKKAQCACAACDATTATAKKKKRRSRTR